MSNNQTAANYRLPKRRKRRYPQAIGNVIASTLKRFGIDKDVARYEFVLHWREIMGEQIADRSRPEALDHGLLTVRVCNSEWAQELVFQKQIILSRLNRFLAESRTAVIVQDVRFIVGDVSTLR